MSWFWNSMIPEISDTCMFLPTAKAIWDALHQTYSKWQELDYYRTLDLNCSKCAVFIKRFIERDRVYDFLASLNSEFDLVRIQISGKPEFPSLTEAISQIRAEESRRGIMLELPSIENSTLLSSKHQRLVLNKFATNKTNQTSGQKNREELWCTYYKKPRHTIEQCWKLHGKPPTREWGQKGGQQRQAHVSVQDSTQVFGGFRMEEVEKLKSMLETVDKPATNNSQPRNQGMCSLTLSGKALVSFAFSVLGNECRNVWILNSGATDHMTHISNKFKTYNPCPSNRKIVVVDGTITTVAGIGDVQVTPKLILKNNRGSGKRIGLAKEHDGLYYLDASSQPEFGKSALSTLSSPSNKDVIWLHHRCLGHVSFSALKIMFPSLFKGFDVQSFHCDICEYAKHTRVPFPISNK
ncbi:uncharacterized protein [Coffea arabica]|uniref:GAG-pre-integrase domain-containing protein n=1 Tax=Coffea arabica TaxID=13443 RepID=A0ABM4U5Z7_COFAR